MVISSVLGAANAFSLVSAGAVAAGFGLVGYSYVLWRQVNGRV